MEIYTPSKLEGGVEFCPCTAKILDIIHILFVTRLHVYICMYVCTLVQSTINTPLAGVKHCSALAYQFGSGKVFWGNTIGWFQNRI